MPVYTIQTSFNRGELSPALHGRVDIDHYQMGLASAINWTVMRQGGVRRRPGTVFVAEVKDSADTGARLIPFAFNETQAYAIEMGDEYARFFALDGQVYSGGSPYEIVTPYLVADVADVHFTQSADVMYMVHASYQPQTLTRSAETSWAFADYVPLDGPYLDENTTSTVLTPADYGRATPIMTSNTAPSPAVASGIGTDSYSIFDGNLSATKTSVKASTEGEIIIDLGSGNDATVVNYTLQAVSNGNGVTNTPVNWTVAGSTDGVTYVTLDSIEGETGWAAGERRHFQILNDAAYRYYRFQWDGVDGGTETRIRELLYGLSPGEQTPFALTASSTVGINGGSGFQASDVGRPVSFFGSDGYRRWFKITAVNSTTEVLVTLYGQALPDLNGSTRWALGAWSEITGWPETIGFFQERLGFGRTATQPRTAWLTQSADYDNFATSTPSEASDGITATMTGGRVNAINFIEEGQDLLVGTSGTFRSIGPASNQEAFSATNIQQRRHTTDGASHVSPVTVGSSTIFVNYFRDRLHEASYSYEANGYLTPELSILSDHLFVGGISGLCYQATPDNLLWVTRDSGQPAVAALEKSQKVIGFTPLEIAGTGVAVESICSVPVEDGERVWMIVKRTIDGATKRYVEYMASPYQDGDAVESAVYFDSAATVTNGTAFTSVTGANHLEGETVGVLADGVDIGDAVVSSGGFTLPNGVSANTVVYGLRYESYGETLRLPNAGNQDGSALGRLKNINEVHVDVYNTGHLKAGTQSKQYDIIGRDVDDAFGSAITPQTGMKKLLSEGRWSEDGVVVFKTDKGYPAVVRAVQIAIEGEP